MRNPIKFVIRKIQKLKELSEVKKTLIELNEYLSSRGVRVLYVDLPQAKNIKGLTSFELERINNWSFDFNKYCEELPKLRLLYGESVTQEYILSVFDGGVVVDGAKRKVLLDFQSEHQHIINGRRITVGQPTVYGNTIYTHGACTWRGTGVEDQQTIASYLQDSINKKYTNSYRVVNSAIGRGSSLKDDFEFIKEQDYKSGDIVILGSHGVINSLKRSCFESVGISYIETSSLFNAPHNYGEWFNDATFHTNHRGNAVIAKAIFEELISEEWLKQFNSDDVRNRKEDFSKLNQEYLVKGEKIYGDNPELLKFIDSIKPLKRGDDNSICGSIVMNCNPFTLGHRYLIEYATKQVDYLYIFVVQENKSYFTFEDRFNLVKKGTADLENVTVLPSGNFIISATTFPGYFYKDNLKEAKIDCSNDINVFCQYIAPALNIKIRFAGQEPLDPVTSQYNQAMVEMFPKYGMQFIVIDRKTEGEEVISASRVRKYFEAGELDKIKDITPATTYEYLVARYKRENG